MNFVDKLLRDSLINWALDDVNDSIKKQILINMSKKNWVEYLYSESEIPILKQQPIFPLNILEERKEEEELEDWLKTLYKSIYIEVKKRYAQNFAVTKWGMKKVNTTGFYKFGPMNAWNEIFLRFEMKYQNGVLFWDIKNYRGKVNPKHFEKLPFIIRDVLKDLGYDFLVRKNSKRFAVMSYSGANSQKLYHYFKEIKSCFGENKALSIGNNAHGTLWIYNGKKRICGIEPVFENEKVHLVVTEKESNCPLMTIKNTDDIHSLNLLIHSSIQ